MRKGKRLTKVYIEQEDEYIYNDDISGYEIEEEPLAQTLTNDEFSDL